MTFQKYHQRFCLSGRISLGRLSVFTSILTFFLIFITLLESSLKAEHPQGGAYDGHNLDRIAFPIGGIGSGMFCLEGTGTISHLSVRHQMERFHEPVCFAAVCLKNTAENSNSDRPNQTNINSSRRQLANRSANNTADNIINNIDNNIIENSDNNNTDNINNINNNINSLIDNNLAHNSVNSDAVKINAKGNIARVLEAPVPDWKCFGQPGSGVGSPGATYGLPRFRQGTFRSEFPFCHLDLSDPEVPLKVRLTAWSPFIPGNSAHSSLPVGALEYTLTNTQNQDLDAVFSFHARNFFGTKAVQPFQNGFALPAENGAFAVSLLNETAVSVDHCWFRGGWWDSLSILWNNIAEGAVIANPPESANTPGASLYLPIRIKAGESRKIILLTTWYFPTSRLREGHPLDILPLDNVPAKGTASGQQTVSGFRGRGLINTYAPNGDGHIGRLVSPSFEIKRRYLHFLVGGGKSKKVGVSLLLDKERPLTARGNDAEQLEWVSWDLQKWNGKNAVLEIFDNDIDGWGHINADHFILSDLPLNDFLQAGNETIDGANGTILLADFETSDYNGWTVVSEQKTANNQSNNQANNQANGESEDSSKNAIESDEKIPETYVPWYAVEYASLEEITDVFRSEYDHWRKQSLCFSELLQQSTLPPEIKEAVEANLTILKSPTILRQHDGRLWCWEGCNDNGGSCPGCCTHVWNYAQSLCHLFPDLERTLRQTEFFDGLAPDGRQAFRFNLPISPGGTAWAASDGMLGCIMKVHRDWKISGDHAWLERLWPQVQSAMDWAIQNWDPNRTGLLQESHHNTYDINYLGPEGHCGSFYLGALTAVVKMGTALDKDVSEYSELLERGRKLMETELFNGEYFIQKVPTPGTEGNPEGQSEYYRAVAEKINSQGPKYQYGEGCLSDGVLGFWMAKVCGIDDDIIDPKKIESHLLSVYQYNLKKDLSGHANAQRPTYALGNEGGLLLCTWPKGNRPLLPFVYSDEVWTGIEYQVASHLMMFGHIREGQEIVRCCRERYNGIRRNPFNEYECGHWYARAMSSFALIQGYSGLRFDADKKTLFVESRPYDYDVPLFIDGDCLLVHYRAEKTQFEAAESEIIEPEINKSKTNEQNETSQPLEILRNPETLPSASIRVETVFGSVKIEKIEIL